MWCKRRFTRHSYPISTKSSLAVNNLMAYRLPWRQHGRGVALLAIDFSVDARTLLHWSRRPRFSLPAAGQSHTAQPQQPATRFFLGKGRVRKDDTVSDNRAVKFPTHLVFWRNHIYFVKLRTQCKGRVVQRPKRLQIFGIDGTTWFSNDRPATGASPLSPSK